MTFGIRPDRPETGYGWLELDPLPTSPDFAPDSQPLKALSRSPIWQQPRHCCGGMHLWNAGIFLF